MKATEPLTEPRIQTVMERLVEVVDLPEIQINRDFCKGCGICIQMCPEDVYQADREGKPLVVEPDRCIWCERCEIYCPDFAINLVGKGG